MYLIWLNLKCKTNRQIRLSRSEAIQNFKTLFCKQLENMAQHQLDHMHRYGDNPRNTTTPTEQFLGGNPRISRAKDLQDIFFYSTSDFFALG